MYYRTVSFTVTGTGSFSDETKRRWFTVLKDLTYDVTVFVRTSKDLAPGEQVIDTLEVYKRCQEYLNSCHFNDAIGSRINPTAENIAKWCFDEVNKVCGKCLNDGDGECYKVSVQESEGNIAVYEIN